MELQDGDTFVWLFMQVQMRWEILKPLDTRSEHGVDLTGLYVVHREPGPDQRRAGGRIGRVASGLAPLSESFDETTCVPADEVWLEGSNASFAPCRPQVLLDSQDQRFEEARQRAEAQFFTAEAPDGLLTKIEAFLRRLWLRTLAPDLECIVGSRITVANTPDYQSIVAAPPVEYCFDTACTKRHQDPWPGLKQFGPFSHGTFAKKSPRIAVLCPDTIQDKVEAFVRYPRDGISARARSRYPAGFEQTFSLINPKFLVHKIPWLATTKENLGAAYQRTAGKFFANTVSPADAALVVIIDEQADLPNAERPSLQSKTLLPMAGVPVQEPPLSTITQAPYSLRFTLQNSAIALYAQLGGSPWTVDHDLRISDGLTIGLGADELSGSRMDKRQHFAGITTVFRGDGNYLLGHISRECAHAEYPVSRTMQWSSTGKDDKR